MESKAKEICDGLLALWRVLPCMATALIVGLQLLASAVLFTFPSTMGEASAMLNLPKDRTITTTVKRAKEKKREVPQLASPPKAHDLLAVVSRAKGKIPQLAPPPQAHDLLAVVSRAKVMAEKAENKANLSGCWDDYTKHGSTETHGVVTVEQQGNALQIRSKKRIYRGQLNGAAVQAKYQAKSIEDMMGTWWRGDKRIETPSRGSLSQAVKMLGHMPVYAYDLTVADRDHMSGTFTGLHIQWESKEKKKVTSAGQVQWPERMVRKTGKIQSLRITGQAGKAISSIAPGGQIRIEARIESVCKVGLQSAMVHVYPGHEKDIGMDVTLIETAPGSGILHSMPLTIHPAWSGDAVRVAAPGGLRGSKVPLSGSKAVQTPAPPVKVQPKPVSSKKSRLAAAKPKQPHQPKQKKKEKQTKPVKWTAYKLVVKTHGSRLPTMDVLKLSFRKGAKRAAFRVMRYPVSMVRNNQTGKIIWSINSAGDVVENEMAIQKDMIDALEIMANDKKKGGVAKEAIAGMINRQLGPDAQQKE